MLSKAIGAALAPFAMLVLSVLVLYPARRAVEKFMSDGWFKRLLLKRISGS